MRADSTFTRRCVSILEVDTKVLNNGQAVTLQMWAGRLLLNVFMSREEADTLARQLSGPTEQPEDSIISRVEREFSTRWAKENPQLFAERLAEFFTTYGKGYLFDSSVRDGFITLIAETPDERARGQSVNVTAEK